MNDNNHKVFWDEKIKVARAWAKGTVDDIIAEDIKKIQLKWLINIVIK